LITDGVWDEFNAWLTSLTQWFGRTCLEIVVATTYGHVWAFRGITGEVVPNFPVKMKGRLHSQALLVQLNPGSPALSVVVVGYDGHVYIIQSETGCVEKVDIGESSYSMVLAEDIVGNGRMQLIVTTRNGNVLLLGTDMPHHPLNSWTSQLQGRNSFTARTSYQGIYVLESTRSRREVSGSTFYVQFEIVDKRKIHSSHASYNVKISIGNETILNKNFSSPGVYTELLPCPHQKRHAAVYFEMTNEHMQAFFDHYAVSFNMNFLRLMKYLLACPFLLMVLVVVYNKELAPPLPVTMD